jgi:hypothetical protein
MPRLSYADSWTATPRGIYFTSSGAAPAVHFYDFASHTARLVRTLPQPPAPLGGLGMAVSGDERWLLYTCNAEWQSEIMMLSGFNPGR